MTQNRSIIPHQCLTNAKLGRPALIQTDRQLTGQLARLGCFALLAMTFLALHISLFCHCEARSAVAISVGLWQGLWRLIQVRVTCLQV